MLVYSMCKLPTIVEKLLKTKPIPTKKLIKSMTSELHPEIGTRLWHFSKEGQISTLDPKFQGSGTPGEDLIRQDTPVTWFYIEDTPTEPVVTKDAVCKYLYTLKSDQKIYDVHSDPEGFWKKAIALRNQDHLAGIEHDPTALSYFFKEIKDHNYFGYRGSKGPIPGAIGIFYPVKVEKEIPRTDSPAWTQANNKS